MRKFNRLKMGITAGAVPTSGTAPAFLPRAPTAGATAESVRMRATQSHNHTRNAITRQACGRLVLLIKV